jgi:hypothetical protein
VPRGTSAEDLVRHAAFIVLREEPKSWNAMDQFPKRARAFGVDVEEIIEAVAPAANTARCRKCGCTEDKACPGGCSWVKKPDPKTGLGLCSSCVRAAGAPRAVRPKGKKAKRKT